MSSSLLNDLNPAQQEAVKDTEGPSLILAGAGSGKTRALTYKVAYLIKEKKVSPENILMVTFTNKAAEEMKSRILKLLNYPLNPNPLGETASSAYTLPVMGTFHSFCAKVLRKDGHILGLPSGFAIYDETDALDAIKEAMANLSIPTQKTSPSAVRHTISSAKNELLSATEYPQYARGYFQETVAKIYLEYQKILEQNYALDFDDLLLKVIRLFQTDPTILTRYQIQFQYILIDEYQDTNPAQYLIAKYLANRHKNICVVGDASQSIYSFRGADFRNIVNFQKDYPNAKVFNLEQNYRSTQNILDAAHAVISKNKSHPILKLWTDKKGGEKIEIIETNSEMDEAFFIISRLDTKRLSDYAILYRTNAQSRSLEEHFLKSGIPYKLYGGISFYQRKEIKDVLSYLRLFQNPKDTVSLKRAEKIGKQRLSKFMELYIEVSALINNYSSLELLDKALEKTEYLQHLEDGTEEGKNRIENVKELRSVAKLFPILTDFLENVSLVESGSMRGRKKDADKNAVTLMTLHSAKGLEFQTVFIVGMEEGLFPHSRTMLNIIELEEERRLMYVGITRAKEKLFLTYTRQRLLFGQRTNNLTSRFLSEIPPDLISTNASLTDIDNKPHSYEDTDDWLN